MKTYLITPAPQFATKICTSNIKRMGVHVESSDEGCITVVCDERDILNIEKSRFVQSVREQHAGAKPAQVVEEPVVSEEKSEVVSPELVEQQEALVNTLVNFAPKTEKPAATYYYGTKH